MTNLARYDFGGRVAIVTGGEGGIGAALTAVLRRQGAKVAVCDKKARDRNTIEVETSSLAALMQAFEHTLQQHGAIDIGVNNAGYSGPTSTSASWSPKAR